MRRAILLLCLLSTVVFARPAPARQVQTISHVEPVQQQVVSTPSLGYPDSHQRLVIALKKAGEAIKAYADAVAANEAKAAAATKSSTSHKTFVPHPPAEAHYGSGACGGDLPPCSVMMCESGGNLTAQNPHSTASGKWQTLDSTWRTEDTNGDNKADSYRGYSRAMDAPESVQDQRAREIYAGGSGRGQWVC